jgi:hypothetical protein
LSVEVIPISSKAEMARFIALPNRLYRTVPNYIAPLTMDREDNFSPKKNPLFEHCDHQFFLARKDGRDVGRISAQIDHLAPSTTGRKEGFFGLIAAEDDPEVFAALFAKAEAWLRERGCEHVLGPMNMSINEEVGLLVDGLDTPPMLMMGHDPAYVGGRIAALGYHKARDLYAYITDVGAEIPGAMRGLAGKPPKGVTLRPVRMNRFKEEVRILAEIWNDAWSENWGAAPLTDKETEHLGNVLKLILIPRLTWFLEVEGRPVGFGVVLPDLNAAIHDLGGRLLPFGWAKLLWRLKVKGVKRGRLALMGVRKGFTEGIKGAILPYLILEQLRREAYALGFTEVEASWVLEDNHRMRRLIEASGARIYKTYRVYGKDL